MNEIDASLICKTLSDSNRIKILLLIGDKELCACKLLEYLQINQSTLSYHMKMLSDCALVNTRKEGKWSHYSINHERLVEFKSFITEMLG